MAGPWEKYKTADAPEADTPAESSGPWAKFQPGIPKAADPEAPRGKKVYDQPAGPEQAGAMDRFKERVTDPQRWKAILTGEGPRAPKIVQGDVPMALPGGALPRLAKAATALAEGQGLGWAAGRTALSGTQGAAQAALDGKEGESWQDKLDRATSGGKLSGGIQLAAESIPVVGKFLGAGVRKLGAATSGIDESVIKHYADRTDEVNQLIKSSGGDITQAADTVRNELSAGIQNTKKQLNAKISQALAKASPEASHDVTPILDKLEAAKARLNPNFKSDAIADIDGMISKIKAEASQTNADGLVNSEQLYQIKQFLNEGSASAYNKGGQIFTRAGEAARAAKDAAGEARGMLKPVAGEIAEADGQLARLHRIERDLNKNLLAAGKPDAALIAAGSGANPRNAAKLKILEEASGVPVTQRAKDLAAARAFSNPDMISSMKTGRSLIPVAIGTAAGAAAGPIGYAAGALASPVGVKLGVNAANVAGKVASRIPGSGLPAAIRANPVAATAATQLGASQIRRANAPEAPEGGAPKLMDAPAKGYDKWASQGIEKLGIRDHALAQQLLRDPEGKRLLIEASKLAPGSAEMKRITDQIKRGWVDRAPAARHGKGNQ